MKRNTSIVADYSRIDTLGEPNHLCLCPDFPPLKLTRLLPCITTLIHLTFPLRLRLTNVCHVCHFHDDGGYTNRVNFFLVRSWSCTYTSFAKIYERDNVHSLWWLRKRRKRKEMCIASLNICRLSSPP